MSKVKSPIAEIAIASNADTRHCALERDLPFEQLEPLATAESWRKEIYRPIYSIHKWWAKRLGSVFRAICLGTMLPEEQQIWNSYYKNGNFSDLVILDPFMGSGTTLGETIKLGARAIGCDVNPISTFTVRQALQHVSIPKLVQEFERLRGSVSQEITQYYKTPDRSTGELRDVLYYFWVKIVETPQGEQIPLFSSYVFARNAYPTKKPRAQLLCPACWQVFEDRYDATASECSHCLHQFNPQVGPARGQYVTSARGERYRIKELVQRRRDPPAHRMYALLLLESDGSKKYAAPVSFDLELFKSAESRLKEASLPLPSMHVRPGVNTDQARNYNYARWRDFFNDRQLLSLGLLLQAIQRIGDTTIREQFLCLFSGCLEFNNIFCSYKGEGTGAVRHMFSHHVLKPEQTPLENNVWGTSESSGSFATLFRTRLLPAKTYLDRPFEIFDEGTHREKVVCSSPMRPIVTDDPKVFATRVGAALVLNGDSAQLPLPDESVDAVVTDPPYFDFVHYSELSDFFFAWLAPVLGDTYPYFAKADSSDPGEVQDRAPESFSHNLARVFREVRRVLKPSGVLAFSFHHSRPDGWLSIHDALTESGLSVVAAHAVTAEMAGSAPKNGTAEPIHIDSVLVCRRAAKRDFIGLAPSMLLRDRVAELAARFAKVGRRLSAGDNFVLGASQLLVEAHCQSYERDTVADCLYRLHQQCYGNGASISRSRVSQSTAHSDF